MKLSHCFSSLVQAACAAVLALGTGLDASGQTPVFDEDFSGGSLAPEWEITTAYTNAVAPPGQVNDFKYSIANSKLILSDNDPVPNPVNPTASAIDSISTNCYGQVFFTRVLDTGLRNFQVTCDFGWDNAVGITGTNNAMPILVFTLLDASDEVIARAGIRDGHIAFPGARYAQVGTTVQTSSTNLPSASTGNNQIVFSRTGSSISIQWLGNGAGAPFLFTGTNGLEVAKIQIDFGAYHGSNTKLGQLHVDRVQVAGTLGDPVVIQPLTFWRDQWQNTVTDWLASLQAADVSTVQKSYDVSKFAPAELYRNWHLVNGYAPPLKLATAGIKQLPSASFLWSDTAGMWRGSLPVIQPELQPYQLPSGQLWIPSHPTTGPLLGWLYAWNRPWNPYFGDPTVARRAAAISIADLVMQRDSVYYFTTGAPLTRLPPLGISTGASGFSLTFNAYTFLQVKNALPSGVRDAWQEGLRWFAKTAGEKSTRSNPENMQLSLPVGIYYTYLASGDLELESLAEQTMSEMLEDYFSPAGYITDGGMPDGSYNGISLHRLAEYWAISGSPEVFDAITKSYALKAHLTLPEPGGGTLSPSHFNARCQDGFDYDQYQGREFMLLNEVPDAAIFAKKTWDTHLKNLTNSSLQTQATSALQGNTAIDPASAWGFGRRIYDWGTLLDLPYVPYHEVDETTMAKTIRTKSIPPVMKSESYTKNFGNEFYAVKRPGYAAIFYAGPATSSDNGATNYWGVLGGEGGYFMGLAGGGLSSFWTPSSGSLILGRLTAREGYTRKTKVVGPDTYFIEGWQDWLNNQIAGKTLEGKILSSSRTSAPSSALSPDGSSLSIAGVLPKSTVKQGTITTANVSYQRNYQFLDHRIICNVVLSTDKTLQMESLYESLPLRVDTGITTEYLDANDVAVAEQNERRVNVKTIKISRNGSTSRLVFDQPVNLSMQSVAATSRQMTQATCRALLVELPTTLTPGSPVTLNYDIVAGEAPSTVIVDDNFSGAALDPAWTVSTVGTNPFGQAVPVNKYKYSVANSNLAFSDNNPVDPPRSSSIASAIDPTATGFGHVYFTRTLPSSLKDFEVKVDFSWDNSVGVSGQNNAMPILLFNLLDSAGNRIASAGLADSHVAFKGRRYVEVGEDSATTTPIIPFASFNNNTITFSCINNVLNISWSGNGVDTPPNSNIPFPMAANLASRVAAVQIDFARYRADGSSAKMGEVKVDRLQVKSLSAP